MKYLPIINKVILHFSSVRPEERVEGAYKSNSIDFVKERGKL